MNEKIAPVDVLAVMDPVERDPHSGEPVGVNEEMEQARAAVAELIEANRSLLASASPHMTHRNAKEREAYRAIRAALARVEGAA